jgi:cob(I)alamin adenosyltransferase
MSIVTKKGDFGSSEYFGRRVNKGGKLLEALGTLDELQAVLGLVGLEKLQKDIYEIMGRKMVGEKIEILENRIKKLEKEIKIPSKFVIFRDQKAIELNWVRTIVRRAERRSIIFKDKKILVYLNRLSDFIYLLALKEEV